MISSHHHHRKRKATAAEGGLLVANGGHFKNNTKHTASSSSASDGDYQLVQHEVLYSPLNNQYEVLGKFSVLILEFFVFILTNFLFRIFGPWNFWSSSQVLEKRHQRNCSYQDPKKSS